MKMIRKINLWCALLVGVLLSAAGLSAQAGNCTLTFPAAPGNQITPSITDYYPDANSASTLFTFTIPTNSPIPAGTYGGWCVDGNTSIDPAQSTIPGTPYFGNIYSTTDSNELANLPNHGGTPPVGPPPVTSLTTWNEINYILNHRAGYFYWDVQAAINTLVGGPAITSGYPYPPSNLQSVSNLVNAAISNAPTYAPQCGDKVGVIFVVAGTNAEQILVIEVPCCNLTFVKFPADTNLGCNPSSASIPACTGTVDTNLVYATSCCGPVTVTCSSSDAKVGCSASRFITYTATDAVGNVKTATRTISWTVNTNLPVITGVPAGGALGYNPTNLPTDASIKALLSATAGCSGTAIINVSHVDSGTPCASVRTFSISAVDGCGNTATAQVIYTYVIDITPPTIACPANLTVTNISGVPAPAPGLLVASDNCSTATVTWGGDVTNGVCPMVITRTYVATDAAGNKSQCTQTITVTCPPCTASLCGNIFVDCDASGDLSAGDVGLTNVTVTLYNSAGKAIASTKTDAYGSYCFYGLAAGGYNVIVTTPAGYTQTAASTGYHWRDTYSRECWAENDGYSHCINNGTECWTDKNNCYHWKDSSGHDCYYDSKGTCHTQACTYVSCNAPTNNNCIGYTLTNCETKTSVNFAYTGTKSSIVCCVVGPTSAKCGQSCTYTCTITNTGNVCFQGGTVCHTIGCNTWFGFIPCCTNTVTCPKLAPGQCCTVTQQCTFPSWCGNNNSSCQSSVSCATPSGSKCATQSSCNTYVSAW